MKSETEHDRYSAFAPAVYLAGAFVAAKVACIWPLTSVGDLISVFAISAKDIMVAAICGILVGAALWLTSRRPSWHRLVWRIAIAFGVVAALWAMVNAGVYRSLGRQLDMGMLSLARNYSQLRSSVSAHASFGVVAATCLVPVTFALLAIAHRRGALWPVQVRIALATAGCLWIIGGNVLWARSAPDERVRRVGQSPLEAMVASLMNRGLEPIEVKATYRPEYLDDFAPAADRHLPALPQFSRPPRNIIVVVLESVGAEYLSVYGSPYQTTPALSAEANHSLIYDRCYAHVGLTYCERIAMFYSVYPGMPWAYRPTAGQRPMPTGLAALLKQRGYRTAYFSASETEWGPLTYFAKDAGMAELYGPDELGARRVSSWGVEDRAMMDGLLRWIDADPKRPFFAMAWTDQTHDPYTLAADTISQRFVTDESMGKADLLDRYLNSVHQVDQQLGRLFDALRERNLADDTLVVITGDHGEAFGELHQDNYGHGGPIYDENVRVPLIFWNPRLFASGQRVQKACGHVDLNPTLAHILGIQPPAEWQGASLFSDDHPGRVYIQSTATGYQFGMTDGRYKYIYFASEEVGRLYDLHRDPTEQHDLCADLPSVASEMRARVLASVAAEETYLRGGTAR